jgi:hypothetical protein
VAPLTKPLGTVVVHSFAVQTRKLAEPQRLGWVVRRHQSVMIRALASAPGSA